MSKCCILCKYSKLILGKVFSFQTFISFSRISKFCGILDFFGIFEESKIPIVFVLCIFRTTRSCFQKSVSAKITVCIFDETIIDYSFVKSSCTFDKLSEFRVWLNTPRNVYTWGVNSTDVMDFDEYFSDDRT